MRLRSVTGTCVMTLALSAAAFSACGSDDGKKVSPRESMGGEAGEAGAPALSGNGGTSVGGGGGGTQGGEGGTPVEMTGGAGGEPSASFHGLYVGAKGDDKYDGTEAKPFKTLAHAAAQAQAGDTIVFLDGAFAMDTAPVLIADGVDLAAKNVGKVTLSGGAGTALLSLAGDTHVSGLTFVGQQRVIQFVDGKDAKGTVTIEDSTFTSCGAVCLELTGAATALVTSAEAAVLGNGGQSFATLSETASLLVTGGVLENYEAAGVIRATDDSSVALGKLEVRDGLGTVLALDKQAVGTVDGATISTLGQVLFKQLGSSKLIVKDSDISMKPNATAYECFDVELPGTGKLTIDTTKAHGCGTVLKGSIPAELNLLDSEFYDLSFGGSDLDSSGGMNPGGVVRIDGCKFHDVAYVALRMGLTATKIDFKMRNTVIDVTSLVNWDAIILNASAASVIDFGTLAAPGGNTFLQRAPKLSSALRLQMAGVTVQAVGNTWTPSAQGADDEGHYLVQTGKTLDVTTATNEGVNYIKPYDTTTIRLAQIP